MQKSIFLIGRGNECIIQCYTLLEEAKTSPLAFSSQYSYNLGTPRRQWTRAAMPVLAPVAMVYIALKPPTIGETHGWGPVKRLIRKDSTGEGGAKGKGLKAGE